MAAAEAAEAALAAVGGEARRGCAPGGDRAAVAAEVEEEAPVVALRADREVRRHPQRRRRRARLAWRRPWEAAAAAGEAPSG